MQRLTFLTSAKEISQCPPDLMSEIAVLGRSNAGKSSLINAWAGAQVARISSTPGKTNLINFYQGRQYRVVDFPGYGFSKRSGDEQATWSGMIENFLSARGQVRGAILVMDVRRDWEDDERMLGQFLARIGRPLVVVLTKIDKLNRAELQRAEARLKASTKGLPLFMVSSPQRQGIVELEAWIYKNWVAST
ncbi:MAG TPA: ribosome biogenesis GTP-binding protein YihA/YsxC [Pseudobdellovibrionaceae bacterium]|nr:ribosome biogenesis GTP-binding protein YihA/YsxC [Pseudobdellovibrionaceae bacterium]